jgi:glycerol-3-phosphate dehydrogenase (NAD(P)+)
MKMIRASVIGGGSWGSAFALHLSRLKIRTRLWVREEEIHRRLQISRENKVFLPGFIFPPEVSFYQSLEEALDSAELIFIAVPSQFCREVFIQMAPYIGAGQCIVSLTKGIEEGSLKRMSEVAEEILLRTPRSQIAVISGPSFAREVAQAHPTAVVIAAREIEFAERVQHFISNINFRAYTSRDVVGVELAGALKNVIAIAAGALDSLHFGYNSAAALMTRGLAEIARLGTNMGAKKETFFGLAGIGDLVLTCTGKLSRNHHLGIELGKGKSLSEIMSGMKMIAEGIPTTVSAHELARKRGVELPICEAVYQVLYNNKSLFKAIQDLMSRALKAEHGGDG